MLEIAVIAVIAYLCMALLGLMLVLPLLRASKGADRSMDEPFARRPPRRRRFRRRRARAVVERLHR